MVVKSNCCPSLLNFEPLLHPPVESVVMDYGCVLSEENKKRVQESLKHNRDQDSNSPWPREGAGMRDSAVLIPLLTVDGEPSILFTLRARDLSRHRNQVR